MGPVPARPRRSQAEVEDSLFYDMFGVETSINAAEQVAGGKAGHLCLLHHFYAFVIMVMQDTGQVSWGMNHKP